MMQAQGKIQKWGNSSAIRLSAKLLAAAGIEGGDEVDIQAENGRLVIQLPERTQELLFDKILAEEPEAEALLVLVRERLAKAIKMTDETTDNCLLLNEKLGQMQKEST